MVVREGLLFDYVTTATHAQHLEGGLDWNKKDSFIVWIALV